MKKIIHILAVLLLTSCQTKNTWECEGDCNNGWGIKIYRDGGIERGTWKNGELIGHGYQFFGETSDFAGDSYQGEFLQGYNGFGKYNDVSEDATYIGYFKNGKFEGKGKLTFGQNSAYPNRYYDGDWKNGMRNGYGVNFWGVAGKHTNNLYQGEWKNDDIDGFGRYDWPDYGTYIGKWKNGEQNGEGIFIFPDGDTLKGLWFGGYCKDLAVMETGKDASYFKTLFDEITCKSNKSNQRFIDELSRELINSNNHSNYRINFPMLRNLLDTALKDQREVLSKLAEINEYDKGIPFKQDYVDIQYAGMDVLNESDKWIRLNLESGDKALIQRAYNIVVENVRIMKQKQEKFEITRKRFSNKYLKKS